MATRGIITVFLMVTVSLILSGQETVSIQKDKAAFFKSDNDYYIKPVPFTSVTLSDDFWLPRIQTIHEITIPHALVQSAGRIMNFRIAADLEEGPFQTSFTFDDTDIYKIIEAASYSLYYNPDEDLEDTIDSLISVIALAQEDDGYLFTCRTIGQFNPDFPLSWLGENRWDEVEGLSHELYNLGHLFESACAYYQATGKDELLNIAVKAADLIDSTFGWGKLEKYPGHQVVELGLARLYRLTGEQRYLDLAKFFLDVRGPGGPEYCQAHERVVDQTTAVGHAVRAVYMYAGMADVAALMNESDYIFAIKRIWDDIINHKTYITGGIGASGSNEGFGGNYNLPNNSAYCETCASIGYIYLNHRLFLMTGESKYIDVLERTLYNALLSGISLSGDRFFYPNRLATDGSTSRSPWFSCACCPPNIARLIPSVPGYLYAVRSDTVYVNLYMSDTAIIDVEGSDMEIVQETSFPWDGKVDIIVNPETAGEYTIMIRLPGWAGDEVMEGDLYSYMGELQEDITIEVNGEITEYDVDKGYACISRTWSEGDEISIDFPMEPRRITAHENVAADIDKFSIQRGPFVYCAEGIDNDDYINYSHSDDETINSWFDEDLMGGVQLISMTSRQIDGTEGDTVTLVPYAYWNNRAMSAMKVWQSDYYERNLPDSLILILRDDSATTNHVSEWESLTSIFDLYDPSSSTDKGDGAFGNWRHDGSTVGSWNWVQYNFDETESIGSSEVYWWRDGFGVNIPDSSYLSYYDADSDDFVRIGSSLRGGAEIHPDRYNKDVFDPVETKNIRLNFYSSSYAQGILEWKVYSPSSAVSVPLVEEPFNIRIFPNPVSDYVRIEAESFEEAELVILDLSGKEVYRRKFTEELSINRSEIGTRGLYLVRITTGGKTVSRKIVLQ